ncbi:MAG: winged helix-turn-helix domain-containing protein [Actinomycetota bacterium]
MEVELLNWPADTDRRARLQELAHPRILLVEPDEPAPITADPLEDWIRLPVDQHDLQTRVETLRRRTKVEPTLDGDGVLRYGANWTALPPIEAALTELLLARFGRVVSREALLRQGWPDDEPTRNVLDVHVLRLRRRLEPLGLSIRTVRKRGYVLSV